jgi:hypothetical protein
MDMILKIEQVQMLADGTDIYAEWGKVREEGELAG